MGLFFLCHTIWGVAKLQDMRNKLSQTVRVALRGTQTKKKWMDEKNEPKILPLYY
jgi:hypothetical protein